MMNDNPIIIESDTKGNASSSSRGRMEFELHSFSSVSGEFKLEIMPSINDSEAKGMS